MGFGYLVFRFGGRFAAAWPDLPPLRGYQVIIFAFSIAFLWTEVMKWGVTKPFNCIYCMTAWLSLIIAFVFHTPFWYFYLPVGLTVGAIYSAVKMRWL